MFLLHSKKDGFNTLALDVLNVAVLFASATYGIKAMACFVGLAVYEEQASLLVYLLWALVYGRFLLYYNSMIWDLLLAELIYAGIMFANYRFFPETRQYYDEYAMFIRQIVVVYIPSMTVAFKIKNFSGGIRYFRALGLFGTLFMIVAYFMGYTTRWDYQYFGVQLCPFVLMLFASSLKEKRIIDFILVIVGFLFLMAGGRQSLVGFIVGMFIVVYCVRYHHISIGKLVKLFPILVLGTTLLYIIYPIILAAISGFMGMMGMDTRTFDMLTANELMSTSTRDDIYDLSLYFIHNNLMDIKGLFADRFMLRSVGSYIAYPHNIVLELMMDFGFVIGCLISVFIIYKYVIRIIRGSTDKCTIIGIIATTVLLRLMVSSSFMIEGPFYTMLGLLFNVKDDKGEANC